MHQRDPAAIRSDAIKLALKRAQSGCFQCMDGYFELARHHGASEEDIHAALEQATRTQGKNHSRRDLIKLLAGTGIAAAAGGLRLGIQEPLTSYAQSLKHGKKIKHTKQVPSIPVWWGTDSSTQACCAMPQNFYIGRMGYGAEPAGDAYFFNINAAKAAGHEHTYGYWGVVGPDSMPSGISSFDWGRRQAICAWNAWNHGPNEAYIGGLTIFGDVEPGFGGWHSGNYTPNQNVIAGFLQELFNITPRQVWPGIYISPYYWTSLVGQNFRPTTDFVLWITGCGTCGGNLCSPCNSSCDTPATVSDRLATSVLNVTLGGRRPVAWQYWISNCQCGDYNVMTQYNNSLMPVNSNTIYSGY